MLIFPAFLTDQSRWWFPSASCAGLHLLRSKAPPCAAFARSPKPSRSLRRWVSVNSLFISPQLHCLLRLQLQLQVLSLVKKEISHWMHPPQLPYRHQRKRRRVSRRRRSRFVHEAIPWLGPKFSLVCKCFASALQTRLMLCPEHPSNLMNILLIAIYFVESNCKSWKSFLFILTLFTHPQPRAPPKAHSRHTQGPPPKAGPTQGTLKAHPPRPTCLS